MPPKKTTAAPPKADKPKADTSTVSPFNNRRSTHASLRSFTNECQAKAGKDGASGDKAAKGDVSEIQLPLIIVIDY